MTGAHEALAGVLAEHGEAHRAVVLHTAARIAETEAGSMTADNVVTATQDVIEQLLGSRESP